MEESATHSSGEGHPLSDNEFIEIYKSSPDEFESLNRLAAQICEMPVSLVNLLDDNYQYTVSKFGDWAGTFTPKEETACQFTVDNDGLVIINDTLQDERTERIKELTRDDSIRFYAGVPIASPNGTNIGALCVIDYQANTLSDKQQRALKDLAKEVEFRIKLLRQNRKLEHKNKKLSEASAFLSNSTDLRWVVTPGDFIIIKSNGAEQILGVADAELTGQSLFELINEINVQRHIKNWISERYDKKLGLPVQLDFESTGEMWFDLTFTEYQGNLLVTGRDITKQQLAEEELKQSLEEKEVLLSEVHHRVKNNLAVITGLLQLERFRTENKETVNILLESESRIMTIAKIHELLYQSDDFANVDVEIYLQELIDYLLEVYAAEDKQIKIELDLSEVRINVNQALPLGLILNELVTNAIKHAFDQKGSGTIGIHIKPVERDSILFEVRDNGNGLQINPSELQEKGNLGFTLIETLRKQINATLEIDADEGTAFRFTFKKDKRKGSVNALG